MSVLTLRGSALLRRLPLLAVLGFGLFLWKSSWLPQERELIWELPQGLQELPRRAEVQLWDGEHLLKREEQTFETGAAGLGAWTWVEKIPLRRGEYRAETFVWTKAGGALSHATQKVRVSGEETLRLSLLPR